MHSLTSLFALGVWISVQTVCITAHDSCNVVRDVEVTNFGYTPLNGPLNWYTLPGSGLCKTGTHQSPILLDNSIRRTSPADISIIIDAFESGARLQLQNIGSAVQVLNANATLHALGRSWTLRNYHFHTPSEHRINLEHSPVEIHLVFQEPKSGDRAVVGILIELTGKKDGDSAFLRSTLSRVN